MIKLAKPVVLRSMLEADKREQAEKFLRNVEVLNGGRICPFEELNESSVYGSEAVMEYFGIEGVREVEGDEELANYNERVKRLIAAKMPAKILAQEYRELQERVEKKLAQIKMEFGKMR